MSRLKLVPTLASASLLALTFGAQALADVSVRSEDGLLTVQASDVTAGELAAELSDQLGISVVVTGDIETPVNVDIVDEPVEKALANLSPNSMLVHNPQATEIIEVVLMMEDSELAAAGGGADEFLPSGSPAEGVGGEQAVEQTQQVAEPQAENNAQQVRDTTAGASTEADLPAEQVPPIPAEGAPDGEIDPSTGLPYQ